MVIGKDRGNMRSGHFQDMTDKTFQKYKLVVDEWFNNGFNGLRAYQKLYPKAKDKTADKRFRELTEKYRVKDYIAQKHEESKIALRTTHEVLLEELKNWAYSDITETLSLTVDEIKELPSEIKRLINRFKHTQRHLRDKDGKIYETIDVVELHFVSKEKAMEMIHKHVGFYETDNKQRQPQISQVLSVDPLENHDKADDSTQEDIKP